MTDLLLSMTPILTGFQIWLWLSHNMHDNHKLESCHGHENKQFHDIQLLSMTFWEIFIFQDFSMTFHDSNFFQDFPWPWEPWTVQSSQHSWMIYFARQDHTMISTNCKIAELFGLSIIVSLRSLSASQWCILLSKHKCTHGNPTRILPTSCPACVIIHFLYRSVIPLSTGASIWHQFAYLATCYAQTGPNSLSPPPPNFVNSLWMLWTAMSNGFFIKLVHVPSRKSVSETFHLTQLRCYPLSWYQFAEIYTCS